MLLKLHNVLVGQSVVSLGFLVTLSGCFSHVYKFFFVSILLYLLVVLIRLMLFDDAVSRLSSE